MIDRSTFTQSIQHIFLEHNAPVLSKARADYLYQQVMNFAPSDLHAACEVLLGYRSLPNNLGHTLVALCRDAQRKRPEN
ncbi:MAG: hypothetical protein ACE1Y4_11460, partial [Lysobacterales bacterium]